MLAIIVASLLNEYYIRKYCKEERREIYLRLFIPIAVIMGLFGAFVMELITQSKSFSIGNLNSGFTFYGGFLMAFVILIIYGFISKIKLVFLINFYAPSIAIAHAIGRIGCFFAGCCYGAPTSFFMGVIYPEGSLPFSHYGACSLHPTQLYESIALFSMFFILNKIKFKYRFSFYVISYAIVRFLVEILRADSRGQLLGTEICSPSQLIAILFVFIGIINLFYVKFHRNIGF
jgi:phosphatidylglycerol:prolipoprotein diacylglycerol transferase